MIELYWYLWIFHALSLGRRGPRKETFSHSKLRGCIDREDRYSNNHLNIRNERANLLTLLSVYHSEDSI